MEKIMYNLNPHQALIEKMHQAIAGSPLLKSFTTQTGLVNYDLQRPAKYIFPVNTPIRNMLARVMGNGDVATRFKKVLGVNLTNVSGGVQEGLRGGVIVDQVLDDAAFYKTIGLENNVTFQARYAAKGFDDVLARAMMNLLYSVQLEEEKIIVGGNSSLALGTTPTPSLTGSTSGGNLATATYSVICVALTLDGFISSKGSPIGTAPILSSVTRQNADLSTSTYGGYSARKSANATVSITGPTGSISAIVDPVRGAVAYAWFWGAAGSEVLGAITTINSVVIKENATGTQTAASLPAADNSRNSLIFDGLISQAMNSVNNAAYYVQPSGTAGVGVSLTPDNQGGIVEIDTLLQNMWNSIQSVPNIIWCNAQEIKAIKKVLTAADGAPTIRYTIEPSVMNTDAVTFGAGTIIGSYTTPYSMAGAQPLKFRIHPQVPPGTMIFQTTDLPYPISNQRRPLEMHLRQDYFEQRWPLRTMLYEYGIYFDGVLVNYFPPSLGIITNIAPG
jgi:hypothetical protein